ncbi:MAG: aspartate aminotransferase family protein [Bacteroidetes bacterium]|nr:aspartate aminotransferase family protein [Bacteroidota bacterium]
MTERELFYRHLGLPSFYPVGLEIERAEGIYLYDTSGEQYIDLVSGIAVSNTGHRHPKVLEAIRDQLDKYLHLNVYGEFIQSPQVHLAERLAGLLPEKLDSVYFVNSGSEAIEGALKLAKRFTGRTEIISFIDAYHGSTHGSLSILGNEALKNAYRPLLPDVRQIEFNNYCHLEKISKRTACVVIELVQAEAGIIPVEKYFLHQLKKRCARDGVLIIVDDVQMGMGRTGKLFSFEHHDFVPDILVLAKALGAGMPLGAFIAPKKVMDTLAFNPELGHITTFGGHPVSCAAALAGLDVLISEGLIPLAEEKGKKIEEKLAHHPGVREIRRAGLALGIDLANPEKRGQFMEAALKQGLIIDWYLFKPATFRIAPPLTITDDEIELACGKVILALTEAGGRSNTE